MGADGCARRSGRDRARRCCDGLGCPEIFRQRRYFQSLGVVQLGGIDLDVLRSQLIAAVGETELLAQVRTFINDVRQDRFGHQYSVAGAPGLSEVYDSANSVPTRVAADLGGLLRRFDGASIGVAGPRGSGKPTLVRQYCDEIPDDDDDLDYDSLDLAWRSGTSAEASADGPEMLRGGSGRLRSPGFRVHLFATFCHAVIRKYSARNRPIPRLTVTALLGAPGMLPGFCGALCCAPLWCSSYLAAGSRRSAEDLLFP